MQYSFYPMHFEENGIYHIYNRGNNKQQVFFDKGHYLYFLSLVRKNILPCCDMLAWCLMPNHFHFLIHANASTIREVKDASFPRQRLSQAIKQLLSTYTKKINRELDFCGSRFQQKTKAKEVSAFNGEYALIALQYIHQNPMTAGLVKRLEDWEFSSFNDFLNPRIGNICNNPLAIELLDLNMKTFYRDSYALADVTS